MNGENWQNGQIAQINDFVRMQTAKDDAIRQRKADVFSKGVLEGKLNEFSISKSLIYNDRINISTGIAYDNYGERIAITDNSVVYDASNPSSTSPDGLGGYTPTPQSTGCKDIPLSYSPTQHNYIFIKYLRTLDTRVISATDNAGQLIYVKADDGYEIVIKSASTTQSDPYTLVSSEDPDAHIFIGYVLLPDDGIIETSNINIENKTFARLNNSNVGTIVPVSGGASNDYTRGNFVTYEHHAQCLGSGAVSKTNPHGLTIDDLGTVDTRILSHEKNLHAAGIIGDPYDANSALYAKGAFKPGQPTVADDIIIEGFSENQLAVAGGNTVNTDNIQDYQYVVMFKEGDTLVSDGVYVIYLNCATKKVELAVQSGAAPSEKYTLTVIDNNSPGHPVVGTPIIENVHAAADYQASSSIPLHETQFFQIKQYNSTVPDAPGTLSNFLYLTDLRMFGTISSDTLSTDIRTIEPGTIKDDSIIIRHQVQIRPVRATWNQSLKQNDVIDYFPEYADNAGAIAAGEPIGKLYRTGDVLKIVHS